MVRWSSILGLKPPDIAVMLIDKTIQIVSGKKRKRSKKTTLTFLSTNMATVTYMYYYIYQEQNDRNLFANIYSEKCFP